MLNVDVPSTVTLT